MPAQLRAVESDGASGAVARQQDLGQPAARDGNARALPVNYRHGYRESPPSTASTWPVMNPARSEHRNATAAATSSAVPSRLIGVTLTISATISAVSAPHVAPVRT